MTELRLFGQPRLDRDPTPLNTIQRPCLVIPRKALYSESHPPRQEFR